MRLLWSFLLLPLVEIALFVLVGQQIGVWATIGLVILSTMAGIALIRQQGTQAALDFQASLNGLRDPTQGIADRTLKSIAGLFLIVPGFLTDALALLLLVPPVRALILRRFAAQGASVRFSYGYPQKRRDPGVIDGEYEIQDDPYLAPDATLPGPRDDKPGPGNSGWTRH